MKHLSEELALMDPGNLPITLYPRRLKSVLLLLLCLGFLVGGVFMVIDGDWKGYFVAILFGFGTLIFFINMLPGASYLRLQAESFTFSSLFRAHTVLWEDVLEFGVIRIPRAQKMVVWNFAPGSESNPRMRRLSHAISGFEAGLPDTYGLKAETLAVLMDSFRTQRKEDS